MELAEKCWNLDDYDEAVCGGDGLQSCWDDANYDAFVCAEFASCGVQCTAVPPVPTATGKVDWMAWTGEGEPADISNCIWPGPKELADPLRGLAQLSGACKLSNGQPGFCDVGNANKVTCCPADAPLDWCGYDIYAVGTKGGCGPLDCQDSQVQATCGIMEEATAWDNDAETARLSKAFLLASKTSEGKPCLSKWGVHGTCEGGDCNTGSCFYHKWGRQDDGTKCGAGREPYESSDPILKTIMGDSADKCCKAHDAKCDPPPTYEDAMALCRAKRGSKWGFTCEAYGGACPTPSAPNANAAVAAAVAAATAGLFTAEQKDEAANAAVATAVKAATAGLFTAAQKDEATSASVATAVKAATAGMFTAAQKDKATNAAVAAAVVNCDGKYDAYGFGANGVHGVTGTDVDLAGFYKNGTHKSDGARLSPVGLGPDGFTADGWRPSLEGIANGELNKTTLERSPKYWTSKTTGTMYNELGFAISSLDKHGLNELGIRDHDDIVAEMSEYNTEFVSAKTCKQLAQVGTFSGPVDIYGDLLEYRTYQCDDGSCALSRKLCTSGSNTDHDNAYVGKIVAPGASKCDVPVRTYTSTACAYRVFSRRICPMACMEQALARKKMDAKWRWEFTDIASYACGAIYPRSSGSTTLPCHLDLAKDDTNALPTTYETERYEWAKATSPLSRIGLWREIKPESGCSGLGKDYCPGGSHPGRFEKVMALFCPETCKVDPNDNANFGGAAVAGYAVKAALAEANRIEAARVAAEAKARATFASLKKGEDADGKKLPVDADGYKSRWSYALQTALVGGIPASEIQVFFKNNIPEAHRDATEKALS